MTSKPPPKRRNAEQTRARILAAAQKSFAEAGYHSASMRDIANLAEVSPTMLLHGFGSKLGLFEAALTEAMQLKGLQSPTKEGAGELLAQALLNKSSDNTTTSMFLLSTSDADARDIAQRIVRENAIASLAKWLGPPDANVRALQIFLLTTGFICYTKILPLIDDVKGSDRKMAKWLGQAIQEIIDQK